MNIEVEADDLINALKAQRTGNADAAAVNAAVVDKLVRENAALKARVAELEAKLPEPKE